MSYFNRYRRLRWKLTLSYTLASSLLFIGVGLILAISYVVIESRQGFVGELLPYTMSRLATQAAPFVVQGDAAGVAKWLDDVLLQDTVEARFEGSTTQSTTLYGVQFVAVVDAEGALLGSASLDGVDALGELNSAEINTLQTALAGTDQPPSTIDNDRLFIVAPIMLTSSDAPIGALLLAANLNSNERAGFASTSTELLGWLALIVALGFIVGLASAYLPSRSLAKRLENLATSAEAWANGAFDRPIDDDSQDEIGQLAHSLNRMALQLQSLLQTQSQVAVLEERTRLARDLHDAAKQQIFATSMQIGAANALMEQNPTAARTHLTQAGELAEAVQKELGRLIQELRPFQLEGKGLVAAIRELGAQFEQRNGLPVTVRVQGEQQLPLAIEQSLLRVVQEGLSNIGKHARAQKVEIWLGISADSVRLEISDDGSGFDPSLRGDGFGLRSMQGRVAELNGQFEIKSGGDGTKIAVQIPL